MSSEQSPPLAASGDNPQRRCPECGATCDMEAARCWLCHAQLPPAAATALESHPAASQQFSIATILLVTTLIAVCLGVFRLSPGFGIAMICFAAPALVRTFVVGVQQKRIGQRLSIGDKLIAFVASLGIMVLVGIAGFVAFQIACWGTCGLISATASAASSREPNWDAVLWVSVGLGSLCALAVGIWILWLTRPRRR